MIETTKQNIWNSISIIQLTSAVIFALGILHYAFCYCLLYVISSFPIIECAVCDATRLASRAKRERGAGEGDAQQRAVRAALWFVLSASDPARRDASASVSAVHANTHHRRLLRGRPERHSR